jgi:8-oxo-dGTP pyrophosphatase MutT (NUDIX family)
MAQTYTIWFNKTYLTITSPSALDEDALHLFDKVVTKEEELLTLLECNSVLFDHTTRIKILISVNEAAEILNLFKTKLKCIMAGGGIVFNEFNQLLLIKRNGFWDLPKGKVQENEKIRNAAIREVEEETGVHIETASELEVITYHCYLMKGECCIKETHWFEMTTTSAQQYLIPQTEEGIEEVIWTDIKKLTDYKEEMYPMIWSILEGYTTDI